MYVVQKMIDISLRSTSLLVELRTELHVGLAKELLLPHGEERGELMLKANNTSLSYGLHIPSTYIVMNVYADQDDKD